MQRAMKLRMSRARSFIEIIDAVDGRPTGKTEILYRDDVKAKGGKNPPAR